MDDILASIRKILNEDEASAVPAVKPNAAIAPLMLTEEMLVTEPAAPSPAAQSPAAPSPAAQSPAAATPSFVAPPALPLEPLLVAAAPAPWPEPAAAPPVAELVAPAAAASAAASMGQLLRAVTQERSSAISRGGPTIEDVVREEVRPMLKEWLDNHLPGIVERAVRSEIERVVSRGS
jgi:cell pole-organizing protein PopZ